MEKDKEMKSESNVGIGFGVLPNCGLAVMGMLDHLGESEPAKRIATGIGEVEVKGVIYQIQVQLVADEDKFLAPEKQIGIIE